MTEADEDATGFEFDPHHITELSDLAEVFVHEELDAALFDDLDSDYIQSLDEYEAAIEVGELILDRIEAAEQ